MNKKPHIDLSNYEIFVIDYLDGQLSSEAETALMDLLNRHPDLKDEVDGLELATLEPMGISVDFKQELKKTPIIQIGEIGESNYETYFIAAFEHDLSREESTQLDLFLAANPQLRDEYALHEKLLLQADESVVYENKEALKKRRVIPVYAGSAVAASLTLLLAVTFFFKFNTNTDRPKVFMSSFAQRQVQQINTPNSKAGIILTERRVVAIPETISNPLKNLTDEPPVQGQTSEKTILVMGRLSQKPIFQSLAEVDIAQLAEPSLIETTMESEFLLAYASTQPEEGKSLFSKVIGGQWKKITQRFTGDKEQNIERQLQGDEPGYIKLIDRSILVFNTVTGSETHVEKSYNRDGHLTDYKVGGNSIYVSRPINSEQKP